MKIQILSFLKNGNIWACISLDKVWLKLREQGQEGKYSLTSPFVHFRFLLGPCWAPDLITQGNWFSRKRYQTRLGLRKCELVVMTLLLTHCVTLAKSLSLSVP